MNSWGLDVKTQGEKMISVRETSVAGMSEEKAPITYSPERRHRRFNLCYPVVLRLPPGDPVSALGDLQTMSRNVSIGGLLVDCPVSISAKSQVSFTIVVQRADAARPILLESEGKVVRVEPQPSGSFAVAIEYSRPLTQMEPYLAAAKD